MSLTDLLRESVKQAIANGQDLTQPSNRTIFLKKFIEDNKDDKTVPDKLESIRPTANTVFKEILGDNNVEMKKQSHKTTKYNSKLASEIAARTTEKKSGIKDEKTKDSKDGKDKDVKTLQTKDGKTIENAPVLYTHWDAQGVGAVFDAMLTPLRIAWPETPPLSDSTKQSLGEMWLPAFQRYGDEKLQYLVFPAIGTIGILAPVIVEGRRKHKEKEEKKKKDKESDKLSKEEVERVNKLTCKFCNEMFDSAHIKGHEGTCKKRINPQ